jgi:ADP-ribosylglycohydrolase
VNRLFKTFWLGVLVFLAGCVSTPPGNLSLPADVYFDKVYGAWQAIMAANHTGLIHEGKYLAEPSPADSIELYLPEMWSTDDDTAVEWVYLHILETYGLDPSYAHIRDEWEDHLNHDIWVSTRRARDLMDQGITPPDTGSAQLNPEGVWSIDAQLQTELFGLIAPGLPHEAARRARYFARVTNSGSAVDVSAFYATMYALAFFEDDVSTLIAAAQTDFSPESEVHLIVEQVVSWHREYPDDWRRTRRLIRDAYDTDPEWWASRVNFASTLVALLYGEGDLIQTLTIACLAGWDADNNATTSAGLLGLIHGYERLPRPIRTASDLYYNEDVTGEMPQYQTVPEIAARTQALAEAVVRGVGGETDAERGLYFIPVR